MTDGSEQRVWDMVLAGHHITRIHGRHCNLWVPEGTNLQSEWTEVSVCDYNTCVACPHKPTMPRTRGNTGVASWHDLMQILLKKCNKRFRAVSAVWMLLGFERLSDSHTTVTRKLTLAFCSGGWREVKQVHKNACCQN